MSAKDSTVDLLLITILEQWPFLVKSADPSTLTDISQWLRRYIEIMRIFIGRQHNGMLDDGDLKIISHIRDQLEAEIHQQECRMMFSKAPKHLSELDVFDELNSLAAASGKNIVAESNSDNEAVYSESSRDLVPAGPPEESEDHPGLNSWSREEVPDAISGGSIAALILCLCSEHVEIRKQALGNMRYGEWQQVFLLTGELIETAKDMIDGAPLPYFTGVLAAQILLAVTNPLHVMYEKVNKFLNRGPSWTVTKLPSYWVDKVMLNPPTNDDAHYQEIEWLLDALIDGLRTPAVSTSA
ncbi:hypothetical protein P7C71_g1736, partial [Lecanoromycetidae sp. Uapishka_2]